MGMGKVRRCVGVSVRQEEAHFDAPEVGLRLIQY